MLMGIVRLSVVQLTLNNDGMATYSNFDNLSFPDKKSCGMYCGIFLS